MPSPALPGTLSRLAGEGQRICATCSLAPERGEGWGEGIDSAGNAFRLHARENVHILAIMCICTYSFGIGR